MALLIIISNHIISNVCHFSCSTDTCSSSTALQARRVTPPTPLTHQRWSQTGWEVRRTPAVPGPVITQDTSGPRATSTGTARHSSRALQAALQILQDLKALQGPGVNTSAAGSGAGTTARATLATAPASAWWGSVRRCTTTGPPAW